VSASAQNTDISGSISLALADWQLDARLIMTAPPRKNAPTAERPAMAVTVRGPLTAARRSVDVTNIVGWVTMRAVEQEAKRLDDAEKERQRLEAAVEALRRQSDGAAVAAPQTGPSPSAPAAAGFDRRTRPGPSSSPGPDR
jgi:hypothetical protein